MESHGGTVGAESEGVGHGATFHVALPIPAMLEAPPDRRDRDSLRDAFAVRLDGRHVLVLATMGPRGSCWQGSSSGRVERDDRGSTTSALEAVHRRAPDAIIADIGLPGEDGRALLRRIRTLPPPAGVAPAIALSAYTRAED